MHELVRFFDRYLKGIDNGWERRAALTWFEREYAGRSRSRRVARALAGG